MVSVQIAALLLAVSAAPDTVLLDFYKQTCPPCRQMDPIVSELAQAGYPIKKVDADKDRALAAQYNVQAFPCFVLVVDGKEQGRIVGSTRKSELVSLLNKARPRAGEAAITRAQSPDPPHPQSGSGFERPALPNTWSPSSPSSFPSTPAPSAGQVDSQALIACSVRLTVQDPQGQSHGTGTIIDARQGEALVLTCGHLFRDSKGKADIWIELCGSPNTPRFKADLLKYEIDKGDVALVHFKSANLPIRVAPVAPRSHQIVKGAKVVTVGCNNGGPATAIESNITNINKFMGPANLQVAGQPVQGRSGGGLFTPDGKLIGVCNAADPADNEGLYASLSLIQSQLDKEGLKFVYENPSLGVERAQEALSSIPSMPARMPQPLATPAASVSSTQGMSETERKARAWIDAQANSGAEVICIVRPLADPQGRSEVIKIDRASSAFLRQLAADQEAQESRHLTSFDVPSSQRTAANPLPRAAR